jgi:2-hydroxychromene-2-carboxylate isomerase
MNDKPTIEWFFDVISPFAYLQSEQFEAVFAEQEVVLRPVVFAGLLSYFGNVGPAEIAPKRKATFERIAWLAHTKHIPLTLPPAHPFNPIPLLRFVIAAGNTREAMHAAFRFVWQEGKLPQDEAAFAALCARFGLDVADVNADAVKSELHANGAHAIERGVFGVPTTVVGEHVFWGEDTADMFAAALRSDAFFDSPSFRAAKDLPAGVQRKR